MLPTGLDQEQHEVGGIKVTGWQAHSVRGAISGAVKKLGFEVTSEKTDGARVYRAQKGAAA